MNIALILAGGEGKRMNSSTPKQFLQVNGYPLIFWTIKAFQNCKKIDAIYLVSHKDYKNELAEIVNEFDLNKVKKIENGGVTRQESVINGLRSIECKSTDFILIHDGARANVSEQIIEENLNTCVKNGNAVTYASVNDSVAKSEDNQIISEFVERNKFYKAQTPQTFMYEEILKAHEYFYSKENISFTDDAQVFANFYKDKKIYMSKGSEENFKITTKFDLEVFECILNRR